MVYCQLRAKLHSMDKEQEMPSYELSGIHTGNKQQCVCTAGISWSQIGLTFEWEQTMSRFQSQLTILQNAINNRHTLHDYISDLHAETLSQTDVSCSYVLYVVIAKYVPF